VDWPNNSDGDVLRRLESDGFDFGKKVRIDFNIDFNHWPLANEEKEAIKKLYPNSEFCDPDEEDIKDGNLIGYVQFQLVAKLTYELVINTQDVVTNQLKQYGGWCESWGVMQE
jgi:Regulator of ribonuclease activity B